jgi:hypothetical protein
MLNGIVLIVVMLNVIMLRAIMFSVVAPFKLHSNALLIGIFQPLSQIVIAMASKGDSIDCMIAFAIKTLHVDHFI